MDVKTETHRDWDICWMSRLRLIETEKFLGCRDRDSLRLGNLMDVETGQKMLIPRLHQGSRWSLRHLVQNCTNLVLVQYPSIIEHSVLVFQLASPLRIAITILVLYYITLDKNFATIHTTITWHLPLLSCSSYDKVQKEQIWNFHWRWMEVRTQFLLFLPHIF